MKKTLLFILVLAMFLPVTAQEKIPASLYKLITAANAIDRWYVDSVDDTKLVEEGIKAMLKQLDPHSTYTDPKETRAMLEEMEGHFAGIGVQFNMLDDTLFVIRTTAAGPSERAGILAGDRVVMVNDTTIAGVKIERSDIMSRLRGPVGSEVKLSVKRSGVEGLLTFNLVRAEISTESVDVAYMVDKTVGYIRVKSFGATTHKEFVTALDSLKHCGMESLVLDLQGNGGGYLSAAVDIANEFLNETNLVVYTDGRVSSRYDHLARGGGRFTKGNIVVLVDETSASAAEILAGAIQDWDRGAVVGRRTFGKGLVQRPFIMPDNSMIRLTIARYYTPTGRCIQKPYGDSINYKDDLMNRYNSGELSNADSIHFPDSLKTYTKRLGRVVYGGGGIMPDFFVPLDTARFTKYHRDLTRKGTLVMAALRYIDVYRAELKNKYPTVESFDKDFKVDELLTSMIHKQAELDSVELAGGEEEFQASLEEISFQLKWIIARDIWDTREAVKIYNKRGDIFQKAYAIIKKRNMDKVLKKEK